MESPRLYDSAEYKKVNLNNYKSKMFPDVDYSDSNCDLANNEVSLNLQSIIDDNPPFTSEDFIASIENLNVEKSSMGMGMGPCPRGMSAANPGIPTTSGANNNIYSNPLPYLPQPVHSQYDRVYERLPIKEEPQEVPQENHEYPPCSRMNYSGYGTPIGAYGMTPSVVPGADHSLLKSPLKSPGLLKPNKNGKGDKNGEDYRRRRERNNIAVRKSREKAKLRSRETEEKVKVLADENRKLQETCKALNDELSVFRSVFSAMDVQQFPEPFRSEMKTRIDNMPYGNMHHGMGI